MGKFVKNAKGGKIKIRCRICGFEDNVYPQKSSEQIYAGGWNRPSLEVKKITYSGGERHWFDLPDSPICLPCYEEETRERQAALSEARKTGKEETEKSLQRGKSLWEKADEEIKTFYLEQYAWGSKVEDKDFIEMGERGFVVSLEE